jgi:hypothetical protein
MTDTQWKGRAPLIEQCRPPHKTEFLNLRCEPAWKIDPPEGVIGVQS